MANPIAAVAGGVASGLVGGVFQSKAASKAADAQTQASALSVEEQRRQFDKVQELLKPYIEAGTSSIGQLSPYTALGTEALTQQRNLIGLGGAQAQQSAINALQSSPMFSSMVRQGENAILQNASATGGLRGGNTQAALAEFRPSILNQLIESQYQKLGGLSSSGLNTIQNLVNTGQASAAQTGAQAQQSASNIAGYLTNAGNARANSALASGQIFSNLAQLPMQAYGFGKSIGAF